MASEIHIGDVGTRLTFTVKDDGDVVDISSAVARQLNIRKPSDTVVNKTPSIFDDGSAVSGVMYYDSIDGDFDEGGIYKIQGKIMFASGTYYTDIQTFRVYCNL